MGPFTRPYLIISLLVYCLLALFFEVVLGGSITVSCATVASSAQILLLAESVDAESRPVTGTSGWSDQAGHLPGQPPTTMPLPPSRQDPEQIEQPAQPYVDQLIDENIDEDRIDDWGQANAASPWAGFSSLSLAGRTYLDHSDLDGSHREYGLQLVNRMESLNNGSFELSADGLMIHNRQDECSEGGRVLLRHNGLVLNDTWQADSELGHFRSRTPRLISTSYRIYLPSTLLQGVGSSIYNEQTSLFLTAGDIGALEGTAAQRFQTTQGGVQGAGLTHMLDDRWQVGAQFWNTDHPEVGGSHQSYAGVVQYAPEDQRQLHQLHILADSGGKAGLWYDTELPIGRWTNYLGAHYLEPDLQWTDVIINNDREGAYWRTDFRSFRWQWTLGSDVSKNNIENDPDLAGTITTQSYVNGSWRFRRDTLLGASANINTSKADSGTASGDALGYTLKNYVSQNFFFGTSRFQAEIDIQDNPEDETRGYSLLWDQVWKVPFVRNLSTSVEYVIREDDADEVDMQLVVEKNFSTDFWLRASGQYIHMLDNVEGRDNAINCSLGVNWQIDGHWRLDLTADYNKSMPVDAADDIQAEGHTVLLSLSYALFGPGRPKQLLGRRTGSLGSGEIRGRVYLDENRNGRYDLSETALRNIVVILDGRFQTETDVNGEFTFWPVAGGQHLVTLGVEDVPLPWGLADDKPARVTVPVRGTGEIDFALIKLNE
jgi:hypothetical protein